jgi:hypothetical protein
MTRIESIIALLKANTGVKTVSAADVATYANFADTITLETISAGIMNSSPLKGAFAGLPTADLLDQMFITLFGYTEAEVDALRATEAGAAGFQYWADEIANNSSVININTLAIALLNGAVAAEADGNGTDGTKAAALVAADVAAYEAYVGSVEETEGQAFELTDGRDFITGTDGNDTITGLVGQNQDGALANAFATGDYIDGKGGSSDTIIATIMNDNEVDSGDNFDINVVTKNVEIAKFEVLDEGVVVDAGNMDSVKQFWSVNSDDSGLVLEDVRLGSKLSITKDLTFGMDSVDYGSDLIVGLDSQSFKNQGTVVSNSQVLIRVADVSAENLNTPVDNVQISVGFTLNGIAYSLEDIVAVDPTGVATAGTYEALKAAVEAAIVAEGLSDLEISFGNSYSTVTAAGNTVDLSFIAREITITDTTGNAFTNVTFSYNNIESKEDEFLFVGNATPVDPTSSSTLIETNLILDNAGRGSTAGLVQIGAMSNSNAGIEKFNVMVDADSAIEGLVTTHNKLQEIEITSIGAKGSLEIGYTQAGLNLIDASMFEGANLMLGATNEGGNTVGELDEDADNNNQSPIVNLKQLSAEIAGDVTFIGTLSQAGGVSSESYYTYNTGAGDDTITLTVDGDNVDTINEGLLINAGNGDNTIKVTMVGAGVSKATTEILDNLDIITGSGVDSVELVGGSDKATQVDTLTFTADGGDDNNETITVSIDVDGDSSTAATDVVVDLTAIDPTDANAVANAVQAAVALNVTVAAAVTAGNITLGTVGLGGTSFTITYSDGLTHDVAAGVSGGTATTLATTVTTVDTDIEADGDANFDIVTGGESDFVYINSIDDSNTQDAQKGSWTFGAVTGAQTFNDRVLYEATLTLSFAGFESTVTVETDASGYFIADQITINNAIKAAIAANPELSRLLETTDGTGDQYLTVTSTVEGENGLTIVLNQPTVVATGATAGQVNFNSTHLNAIQAGLVETGVASDSAAADTVAEVVTLMDTIDGDLSNTGSVAGNFLVETAGGSVDETAVTNYSTIDLGAGSNDLVVLNSDDQSANTLVFSDNWGKVSVVNFFTDGVAQSVEGEHILDFTAFLTTQLSSSGSALSATTIATTVNTNGSVEANSITQVSLTEAQFDALTATSLLNDLNDEVGATALFTGYTNVGTAAYNSTTYTALMMVENGGNAGEYKVYQLTVDESASATKDFTAAELLGTIDFGNSITLADVELA